MEQIILKEIKEKSTDKEIKIRLYILMWQLLGDRIFEQKKR
jgi:hypothetical protein